MICVLADVSTLCTLVPGDRWFRSRADYKTCFWCCKDFVVSFFVRFIMGEKESARWLTITIYRYPTHWERFANHFFLYASTSQIIVEMEIQSGHSLPKSRRGLIRLIFWSTKGTPYGEDQILLVLLTLERSC